MLHKTAMLTTALAAVFLGESSWGQSVQGPAIIGTVTYLQRIALSPDAVVNVQLQDVSLQDVPAKVISEVKVATEGKQVPISFRIPYAAADIDPAHSYVVRATILVDENMMFSSTTSYPAITRGAPTEIEIIVRPVSVDRTANPLEPKPAVQFTPPATFTGDLPCADCVGIRFTLTLRPDGIFLSRTRYRGNRQPFYGLGRWSLQNDDARLVLRGGKEAPQQFAVKDADTIRQLDTEGHEIVSKLNYDLKRAATVDPITDVLSMTGEFIYVADAGAVTECRTGVRWPIAQEKDNAALERAYSISRLEAGKPLLLTFDGHFTKRPQMEGSGEQEVIVVDKFIRVLPADERCPSSTATPQLEATDWKLIELGGIPVVARPSTQGANLVLSVAGKKVAGSSGCNRIAGVYELENNVLRFKPLAVTMMACIDPLMKQEQVFIEALKATSNYRIAGDTLELRHGERVVARFKAEAR